MIFLKRTAEDFELKQKLKHNIFHIDSSHHRRTWWRSPCDQTAAGRERTNQALSHTVSTKQQADWQLWLSCIVLLPLAIKSSSTLFLVPVFFSRKPSGEVNWDSCLDILEANPELKPAIWLTVISTASMISWYLFQQSTGKPSYAHDSYDHPPFLQGSSLGHPHPLWFPR